MKKENLQKSIVLLGPSCVGKSLLSGQLAEELNLPVICVDDVFAMAEYDFDGLLSKDEKTQKQFAKTCYKELQESTMAWTLHDKRHSEVIEKQISNIITTYNRYHDILGGYEEVKKYLPDYGSIASMGLLETICYYNYLSLKVAKMLLKKIDTPVILDVPGLLGWEMPLDLIPPKVVNKFKDVYMDIQQMNQDVSSIFSLTQTVLLEPGRDYYRRNASKESPTNNLALRYFENYLPNAKVQIATNDLFYNPENRFFQKRRYIDAREALTKEELKNRSEIKNICHQILEMLEQLSLEEELNKENQQQM